MANFLRVSYGPSAVVLKSTRINETSQKASVLHTLSMLYCRCIVQRKREMLRLCERTHGPSRGWLPVRVVPGDSSEPEWAVRAEEGQLTVSWLVASAVSIGL